MATLTQKKQGSRRAFTNAVDYWRRRRGMSWDELTEKAGYKAYQPVLRAAQSLTERTAGGRANVTRLANALEVEVWQLHIPAEECESRFGKIISENLPETT